MLRVAEVVVTAILAPAENPITINNCFEKIFDHEVDNTNAVYKLLKMSLDEEDWSMEFYAVVCKKTGRKRDPGYEFA